MRNLFFYILLSSIVSSYSQKIVTTESFDNKEFNKTLRFNTWGNANGAPDAKFSFSNIGHNDDSCLKVFVRQNTDDNTASKASLDVFGVSLTKNKKYKLSYYIKSRSLKDKIAIVFYSAQSTGGKVSQFTPMITKTMEFKGDGKWTKQEVIFKAVKKNKAGKPLDLKHLALGFGFNTRRGTFYLDDIKIQEVK